jgi:hypothetical protein
VAEVGQLQLIGGAALQERGAEAAVEAGDGAEQFAGLAVAARQQQHARPRHEQGLGQTEQGDGGRFAGLAAAVEQQAALAAFEHLGLPAVGRQAQVARQLHSGRAGWGHGAVLAEGKKGTTKDTKKKESREKLGGVPVVLNRFPIRGI